MGGGLHVALSGGGYRSTLFSIGSLFHLVRGGHLGRLVTLSSVSGGSYTNALAMAHPDFAGMDAPAYIEHFRAAVAATATRPVWSRLVRNRPDRHRDEPLVHTIMWENLIARTTVEWPVDSAITHVVEAANLHDADLIAFSNRGHRSQWLGHDPARTVPVRDAVSASSAIPLLFPPRRVSTRSFRRSVAVDVPPSVLSVDGGVLDSLAVSCLDLETIESGDPHTHLVVDATHSVTTRKWIPGTTLPIHRELLPGATWIASAFRATQVLADTADRTAYRQLTERFAAQPGSGRAISVRESPLDHGGENRRAQLLRLGVDWARLVRENAATPTRPAPLGWPRSLALLFHGYVNTWAACPHFDTACEESGVLGPVELADEWDFPRGG